MTNGEKYKTAKERAEAFYNFCILFSDQKDVCEGCPVWDKIKDSESNDCCEFAWLELEAEDEKPLPCPFCGVVTRIVKFARKRSRVECALCGYASKAWCDEHDAISAHNRVAKAVKESEAK